MLKLLASPYPRSHLKIIPVQKMVTFYAYKKITENGNTPIRRRKKRWEKLTQKPSLFRLELFD